MIRILCLSLVLSACSSLTTETKDAGQKPKVKVHGHRGSRGTHPENTLSAMQEGVEAGVDVLEFDLHLSKDKVPMLAHDSAIPREFCKNPQGKRIRRTVRLQTITAAEIQKYDCGSLKNPKFPEQIPVPGAKMPRLEEVLAWVAKNAPNVELNIETKMDEPKASDNPNPKEFASIVIELLKKYGLLEKTILQSFDFRTLVAAKEIEPSKLKLAALVENDPNFCELAENTGAHIASPYWELVTPANVKDCHSRGIEVAPWTANTEQVWVKLLDAGVDGIITDFPKRLVLFLKPSTTK